MYGDENSMRLHYFFIVDNFLLGPVDYNPIARFLIFFKQIQSKVSTWPSSFFFSRPWSAVYAWYPRFTAGASTHALWTARSRVVFPARASAVRACSPDCIFFSGSNMSCYNSSEPGSWASSHPTKWSKSDEFSGFTAFSRPKF